MSKIVELVELAVASGQRLREVTESDCRMTIHHHRIGP
jgi:hypothetical protein